jgi:hypothetical protein
LVDIKIEDDRLLFALPEPQFREAAAPHLAMVADGLGIATSGIARPT